MKKILVPIRMNEKARNEMRIAVASLYAKGELDSSSYGRFIRNTLYKEFKVLGYNIREILK